MKNQFKQVTLPIALVLTIAAAWLTNAGPLTPPAGAITPTMKRLDEVEPRIAINAVNTPPGIVSLFRITEPGSYYLTGNLIGEAGRRGIEIDVPPGGAGVTIDLMGYELVGVLGTQEGVKVAPPAGLRNIAIRNGTVRGWSRGIDLGGSNNNLLEDLRTDGNFGTGLSCGAHSTLKNCLASNNAAGIAAGFASTVTDCGARANTLHGILVGDGSTMRGCTAQNNGTGILAGAGSVVANCAVAYNTGAGIVASPGSTVTGCTARFNTGDGIQVADDSRVTDNTCQGNGADGAGVHVTGSDNRIEGNNLTDNDRGIDVDAAGNLILRNSASGNTTDYDIAAGNSNAQVLAPGAGFVSTDPWANFSY